MLNINKKFDQIRANKGGDVIVLDGGLATQLESVHNANIKHNRNKNVGNLWSGNVLLDSPTLVQRAHQDFVEAGANIVITNTYQCNLEEFGNDQNAFKEFINDAVEVAKLSGAEVVAGSIGPYGAKYKDGTSYTGIYNDIPIGMDEKEFLKKWHLPRIQCLIKNGVDILAFETCPKLIEGLAFSELIQELQFPGFICFQCRNENETAFGEKIESALDVLVASPYLIGVGINCVSLRYASKLMDKFVDFQQNYRLKNPDFKKLEIIAYPNSGEIYNGQDMVWISDPEVKGTFVEHSEELVDKGATIIGGCCRVFASDIWKLSEFLKVKKSF